MKGGAEKKTLELLGSWPEHAQTSSFFHNEAGHVHIVLVKEKELIVPKTIILLQNAFLLEDS